MDRLKRIGVARLGLAWVLAWAWILAHWALYREPLTVAGVDLGWLLEGAPWMLGAALYFGAAAAFVLRRAQITTGLFLVVALGLLGEAERQVRGDVMPPLVTLLGATVILAWLAGRYLPGGSAEERAERGHELACGVLAAHLFLAALAKLALSGPGWVDGEVHALLIYERADGALLFLGDLTSGGPSPRIPPSAARGRPSPSGSKRWRRSTSGPAPGFPTPSWCW